MATTVLVPLLMRIPVAIPRIDAAPTTIVIAISVGEKVPEIRCDQPSRNNQMRLISKSQQMKQGIAVHLLHRESRNPRMTVGHTGAV